jgi:hypothetical protein
LAETHPILRWSEQWGKIREFIEAPGEFGAGGAVVEQVVVPYGVAVAKGVPKRSPIDSAGMVTKHWDKPFGQLPVLRFLRIWR